MTTRWTRVARGWVTALVATFVAACSHALSGGSLPGSAGLALCLAFSGVVCVLLAGRTLSLGRLAIAVTLSQAMFHSLFSLMTDAGPGARSLLGPVGGMQHGGPTMLMQPVPVRPVLMQPGLMQPGPAASVVPPMDATADLRMWTGHAIAAVVTIAVLAFGERAFWGLTRLARLAITHLLVAALPVETALPALPRAADRAAAPRLRHHVFSIQRHRGPPALAL